MWHWEVEPSAAMFVTTKKKKQKQTMFLERPWENSMLFSQIQPFSALTRLEHKHVVVTRVNFFLINLQKTQLQHTEA